MHVYCVNVLRLHAEDYEKICLYLQAIISLLVKALGGLNQRPLSVSSPFIYTLMWTSFLVFMSLFYLHFALSLKVYAKRLVSKKTKPGRQPQGCLCLGTKQGTK